MTETDNDDQAAPRVSPWVIALELASVAVLGAYLWVLLHPDPTERTMRLWRASSRACYSGAEVLGRAGMACERRYLSVAGGL